MSTDTDEFIVEQQAAYDEMRRRCWEEAMRNRNARGYDPRDSVPPP